MTIGPGRTEYRIHIDYAAFLRIQVIDIENRREL